MILLWETENKGHTSFRLVLATTSQRLVMTESTGTPRWCDTVSRCSLRDRRFQTPGVAFASRVSRALGVEWGVSGVVVVACWVGVFVCVFLDVLRMGISLCDHIALVSPPRNTCASLRLGRYIGVALTRTPNLQRFAAGMGCGKSSQSSSASPAPAPGQLNSVVTAVVVYVDRAKGNAAVRCRHLTVIPVVRQRQSMIR